MNILLCSLICNMCPECSEASMSVHRLQVEVEEGRADLSRLQASRQVLAGAAAHIDTFEQKQQLCRKFYGVRLLCSMYSCGR